MPPTRDLACTRHRTGDLSNKALLYVHSGFQWYQEKLRFLIFQPKQTEKAMGLFEYMRLLFCHRYKICPWNPRFQLDPSPRYTWPRHSLSWPAQPIFPAKAQHRETTLRPEDPRNDQGKKFLSACLLKNYQKAWLSSLDSGTVLLAHLTCFHSHKL